MDLRIKAALISIIVNVLLIIFKFVLAKFSGSVSLHADGWHSISDFVVSLFVLAGLKVTAANEKRSIVNWPGLEEVIAFAVGAFILYTGWRIFRDALQQPAEQLRNVGWVIVGALGCVLASYLIATMKIRVGRMKNSPSLIADGYHSKMDVYSTVAVVVGLFGVMIGINLDRIAAGLVSILIAVTGVEIMVGSVKAMTRRTAVTDYFLSALFELGKKESRGGRFAVMLAKGLTWLTAKRRYMYIISGVLIAAWVVSGLYVIQQGEEGIVFRFGKLERTGIPPGLHFRIPSPIERLVRAPVGEIQRVELGFRTVGRITGTARAYEWESRHQSGSYEKRLDESLVFTGDENIIDINTVIQYRVKDATRYVLNIEEPASLVSSCAEASLRRIVSTMNIESLLTTERTRIEGLILTELQHLIEEPGSGIEIIAVKLQDVHPPIEVVSAFREVASAREDKNRLINQAESYRDSLLPEVRGLGAKLIAEANAENTEAIEHATGESERFLKVIKQYQRTRDVTEIRLYLEAMERVLPGLEKFVLEPDAGGEPLDLRYFDESVTGIKGGW